MTFYPKSLFRDAQIKYLGFNKDVQHEKNPDAGFMDNHSNE